MDPDNIIRTELIFLLEKGSAHMTFEEAVADFPIEFINTPFPESSYTPWQLLEHMRRIQFDILDFMENPDYKEPVWPDDYWPLPHEKATESSWERTIRQYKENRKELVRILKDTKVNLYAVMPQGTGQNRIKEILTVADHNAYHIGEFAIMRQVMKTWRPKKI